MTREGGASQRSTSPSTPPIACGRSRSPGSARRWAAASATITSSIPFTARDFYRLAAFFADVKQWGVYADYGYTPNPDLRGFTNDHPFPPEIEVISPYLLRRQERLRQQMKQVVSMSAAKLTEDGRRHAEFDAWQKAGLDFLRQVARRLGDTPGRDGGGQG